MKQNEAEAAGARRREDEAAGAKRRETRRRERTKGP